MITRTRTAWIGAALVLAAGAALGGCSNERHAYETCEPGQCRGVEGCSDVRVEYVEGAATASICTDTCAVDTDCPVNDVGVQGACGEMFIGAAVCFERCTEDADCPPGMGCVDRLTDAGGGTVFFEPICLPVLAR